MGDSYNNKEGERAREDGVSIGAGGRAEEMQATEGPAVGSSDTAVGMRVDLGATDGDVIGERS